MHSVLDIPFMTVQTTPRASQEFHRVDDGDLWPRASLVSWLRKALRQPKRHASVSVSIEDWEDGMAQMSRICRDYALVFALAAGLPAIAWADAASETVTAQMHADLAAHASDLAGVQMHLHHALNCLVGPGGEGFDPKQMNPCANAGKGAIPDSTDPAQKKELTTVADKLKTGIAATDIKSARQVATETAGMLKHK